MDRKATDSIVTVIGIDIGKNTFHVVGLDERGAIALRQKLSRGQVTTRLANMAPCLVGMEACVGAHHLSRQLHLQAREQLSSHALHTGGSGRAVAAG